MTSSASAGTRTSMTLPNRPWLTADAWSWPSSIPAPLRIPPASNSRASTRYSRSRG